MYEPNKDTKHAMDQMSSGQGVHFDTAESLNEVLGMQYFDSIWDALEDTRQDALLMRLRSSLLMEITQRVELWESQGLNAAEQLGITLAELELLRVGKIHRFSLEDLLGMSAHSDLRVELTITDD